MTLRQSERSTGFTMPGRTHRLLLLLMMRLSMETLGWGIGSKHSDPLGRRPAPCEEHVAGLDVEVNHPLFVQIRQGLSNVQRDACATAAHRAINTQFQEFLFWSIVCSRSGFLYLTAPSSCPSTCAPV